MKKETKDEKRKKQLAELFGIEEHLPEVPVQETPKEVKTKNDISREAEAVLFYIYDSRKFIQKECGFCGYTFVVNRGNVAYCSDNCRRRNLARIGITWNPDKDSSERWDFREPLVVPPQVLEHLEPYLQKENEDQAVNSQIQETVEESPAQTVDDLLASLRIE
jgi:hypothetical protein